MGRPPGSKNKSTKEKAATAKKPRKAKAKAAEKEAQATSSESSGAVNSEFKRPTADQVVRLAKRIDSVNGEADTVRISKKEMLDKAVETQHFNKPALGAALSWRKRAKKDPVKFATEFAHFLSYIDDLELDKIANENRGMDFEDDDEGGETGDEATAEAQTEQQPAPARGLRVVPGANAPTDSDVPAAPKDEQAA